MTRGFGTNALKVRLVLVLAFFGADAISQVDTTKPLSLEDLAGLKLVAPTRTSDVETDKASATVTVITEEVIKQRNYESLLDVLADVPGVKIDYAVDPRWMHDVTIRGVRGMDRFIILIDGVRASSPTNDIIPLGHNYPVQNAKQIEILYGPVSALYGADAFSGVINIITKEPNEDAATSFSIKGGMFDTYTLNGWTGKKLSDDVSLTISGQYHYDHQPDLWEFYPEDYEGIDSLNSGVLNTVFGPMSPQRSKIYPTPEIAPISAHALHASLQVKDLNVSFFTNYNRSSSTMGNSPNNAVYNKSALMGHRVGLTSITYDKDFGELNSKSFLIGSMYRLDPLSNFRNVYTALEPAYLFSLGRMVKLEELLSWRPNDKVTLAGGATFEYFYSRPRGHDLDNPAYGDDPDGIIVNTRLPNNPDGIKAALPTVEFNNVGVFAQGVFTPNDELAITIGGRFDHNSRFGSTVNPRIGVVWSRSASWTVKGMYGTAYLAPSPLMAFDQFGTFMSPDSGMTYQSSFFRLPNPNLQPQLIRTAEISIERYIGENFSVSVMPYYSEITGLFDLVSDAEYTNLYDGQYQGWPVDYIEVRYNLGEQHIYGGTARADFYKRFDNQTSLRVYGALTYVDGSVDIDEDGPTTEVELPAIAPFIGQAGTDVSIGSWNISIRTIIVGEQRTFTLAIDEPDKRQTIDGYIQLNCNIGYQLNENIRFYCTGTNLLDQRYYNVNSGASPQSTLQGAAQAEFANGTPQNPLRVSAGVRIDF